MWRRRFATGLHQVDNPAFDRDGNLYVTYSGTRGQQVPVSIFRVRPDGTREPFCTGLVNPTSMALGPDGDLYVSSRFEGTVYRVKADGAVEPFATDLGVACGLAFDRDGTLFVGDRSGTIFRVDRTGQATTLASVPSSVAAFHLAFGPDERAVRHRPDAVAVRLGVPHRSATARSRFATPASAGRRGSASIRTAICMSSKRSPARAACTGCRQRARRSAGEPELVLAGPGLVGVAFRSERRRGGLLERHRLSPATVRLEADMLLKRRS